MRISKVKLTKIGELCSSIKYDGFFQYPTPFILNGNIGVIYTNRVDNKSIPCYMVYSKDLATQVVPPSNQLIPLGPPGTFYSQGIAIQWVSEKPHTKDDLHVSYYALGTGYTQGTDVPYRTQLLCTELSFTGNDFLFSKSIRREETSPEDLISTCTPAVVRGELLYNSHTLWTKDSKGLDDPVYCVRDREIGPIFTSWDKAYTRPWECKINSRDSIVIVSSRSVSYYRSGGPGSYRPEMYLSSFEVINSVKSLKKLDIEYCNEMIKEPMIAYGTTLEVDGNILFFYNSSFDSRVCIALLEVE